MTYEINTASIRPDSFPIIRCLKIFLHPSGMCVSVTSTSLKNEYAVVSGHVKNEQACQLKQYVVGARPGGYES